MNIASGWSHAGYIQIAIINLSSFLIGCYLTLYAGSSEQLRYQEALNTEPGSKLVISFALYGNDSLYTTGALRNAEQIPALYPGWIPRFYIDHSVPSKIVDQLRELAEVITVNSELDSLRNGRLWRYLALADPTVQVVMFRDCDARISTRELEAVSAWLELGYKHHVMRDHPSHDRPIIPGQWAATAVSIRSRIPLNRALQFISAKYQGLEDRALEDAFLTTLIWPLIMSDVLVHDAFNCESTATEVGSVPFPGPREWHGDYVGRRIVERFDEDSDYFKNGQTQLYGGITPMPCRLLPEHVEG